MKVIGAVWHWPFQRVHCPEKANSVAFCRMLLGSQLLHQWRQTDWRSSTNLLGVDAFMQQMTNATQRELQTSTI